MPPTKHPKEYRKCEDNFTLGDNPDRANGQASVTRLIESHEGLPLGSDGQTRGFVKSLENAPKHGNRLFGNPLGPDDDGGLITRQVASHRADQLLGLNVLCEEKFGKDEHGQPIGISIQADGSNILNKKSVLQVDCTSPTVQRGLSNLQVSDFICGQVDRNPGNIFIDPETGKVTGIDNDLAFPEKSLDQVKDGSEDLYLGMPRVMHEETKAKILKTDPIALRRLLSEPPPDPGPKPLSPTAIDGAVNRLIALQMELRKPNSTIQVVKEFNRKTYADAMAEQEKAFQKELNSREDSLKDYFKEHGRLTMVGFSQIPNDQKGKRVPAGLAFGFLRMQRTSLLGSIEAEKLKFKAVQVGKPDDMGEHSVGKRAPRLTPEQRERATFEKRLADAYDKMSQPEKKSFDQTFARLSKLEKDVASKELHLQHPSLMDRLNALTKGDTAMRNQKQQSIATLRGQIQQTEKDLNKLATQKLPKVIVQPPLDQPNPLGQGQLPIRPRIANQPKRGAPTVDVSNQTGQGPLPIRPGIRNQPKRTAITGDQSTLVEANRGNTRKREDVRSAIGKDKGKRPVLDGNKVDQLNEQAKIRSPKNKPEVLHVSDTTGIKSPSRSNNNASTLRRKNSGSISTS